MERKTEKRYPANNKLKGRIIAMYGNQQTLARSIGWSESKLSRYLTGEAQPGVKEIKVLCAALKIGKRDLTSYFFG